MAGLSVSALPDPIFRRGLFPVRETGLVDPTSGPPATGLPARFSLHDRSLPRRWPL